MCTVSFLSIHQFFSLHFAVISISVQRHFTLSQLQSWLFLHSSMTAGTVLVFPATLLWSFIKGCFKHRSCIFVAQLQTDDLLRRDGMGESPALSTAPASVSWDLHADVFSYLNQNRSDWQKFYYLTHLNLNKLKIGVKTYYSHSCQRYAHRGLHHFN